MKIDKILLRAERPEDAPEIIANIIRIEEVVIVREDGSEETDYDAGFNFQFIDGDDSSFQQMIENVAKKYRVETYNVQFTQE